MRPTSSAEGGTGVGLLSLSGSKWPVFEFVLLLAATAVGWAALHIHGTLNEWEKAARPLVTAPGTPEIQEILRLQTLIDVRDVFANVADEVESGVVELRDALEDFLKDKNRTEIGRYLKASQALGLWLQQEQESIEPRKIRTARDWLGSLPPPVPGASNSVHLDLEAILSAARRAYSNHLAIVRLTEGQSLTPDLVQQKLDRMVDSEKELRGLATLARSRAAEIGAFVDRRPTDLAREARRRGSDERLASFMAEARVPLGRWFKVLLTVFIVLCGLLIVALYARFVVSPLRQKLMEDAAAIEHQRKLDQFARLATGLAHEIRNPLTAINVRLFTLQKSMGKGTSEHGDAALIRNEIDRLEQILKSFLKLARPIEPRFSQVKPELALREVRDLFAPQLLRQAIELKLDSVPDTSFQADPLQLKQVLINLVQNAADAIGRRGAITLRARRDEVQLNGQSVDGVILEVEDTGEGIVPEVQERLFDPFFSTKENGTGLGLPIAAKIIAQHKGMLDFETRPGHGTTFRVILPMSTQ